MPGLTNSVPAKPHGGLTTPRESNAVLDALGVNGAINKLTLAARLSA